MNDILDFFIGYYKQVSWFWIVWESLAMLMGVWYVFLSVKANVNMFLVGFLNTLMYTVLLYRFELYGDMIINAYYTIMSIVGWMYWPKKSSEKPLPITNITKKDWAILSIIMIAAALLVAVVYGYKDMLDRWYTKWDMLTNMLFFGGMYALTLKKLENWHFWIIGNGISIFLYAFKGLGISMILYIVLFYMAFVGLKEWRIKMKNQNIPDE